METDGRGLVVDGVLDIQGTLWRYGTGTETVTVTDNDSGTVVYYNGTVQDYGAVDYFGLEIQGGAATLAADLGLARSLRVHTASPLNGAGFTVSLPGDWRNDGTYNSGGGLVEIQDPSSPSLATGSNTFTDLEISAAGKTGTCVSGSTQTVSGSFTVQGGFGNPVVLDATTGQNALRQAELSSSMNVLAALEKYIQPKPGLNKIGKDMKAYAEKLKRVNVQ